jgi:hypothetical protein
MMTMQRSPETHCEHHNLSFTSNSHHLQHDRRPHLRVGGSGPAMGHRPDHHTLADPR